MKAKRSHIVPLSRRCQEILKHARAIYPSSDLIFPGTKLGSALSDMTFTKVLRDIGYSEEATPHGMRSAFKVWCAEVAKVRDEVSEAALAHTIPEKARAAYLRTDFLDERKALMIAWERYCTRVGLDSQTRGSSETAAAEGSYPEGRRFKSYPRNQSFQCPGSDGQDA
jgi:integrase